ncbi:MAG: hypothetical protein CSA62_08960 [Planctomycetota bacterium]|nr:MAG: hypothetical protein CSA62_08960 [Planctomycetota bacterium]
MKAKFLSIALLLIVLAFSLSWKLFFALPGGGGEEAGTGPAPLAEASESQDRGPAAIVPASSVSGPATKAPSTGAAARQAPRGVAAGNAAVQPKTSPWPEIQVGAVRSYRGPAPKGAIVFPDGTWFPPINGVKDPQPHPGFKRLPWSPVVELRRDSLGQYWFQHANGATSSIELAEVTERGVAKKMAIWKVGIPVRPVDPDLGAGQEAGQRAPTKR